MAAHAEGLARPCASRDLQRDLPVEGRHFYRGAERGVGIGDRHPRREVATLAPDLRVLTDSDDDEEVTCRPTVEAGAALALESDALAVLDTRRDARPHLPRPV